MFQERKNWQVVFFESVRGAKPVETFIQHLEVVTRVKITRTLELLKHYGHHLTMPHSKKVSSQLYELRIRAKAEIRIFYTFKGDIIYLLHAFQKKTQKIPQRELEIAKNRLQELD